MEDTPTIYEWAGGREAFARWLNAFYDLVEDDEDLAGMFGGAVSDAHREHVVTWWCEVMGGLGGPRFRLLTGRATEDELQSPLATGREALELLDAHLAARDWLVGAAPSIADLSLFAYVSVTPVELPANVAAWLDRVRALPGFVDDFVTYPENARPGAGSSIY